MVIVVRVSISFVVVYIVYYKYLILKIRRFIHIRAEISRGIY